MNPASKRHFFRQGLGVGWLIVLLWGVMTTMATAAPGGLYQVGVEVSVPLPATPPQDPRTIGMDKAKKLALEQLLRRMFSHGVLIQEKPFFDALQQGAKTLTERVVVVGEQQKPNQLQMAVEVTFSAKGVAAALAPRGLSYNEARHPPVLLVGKGPGGVPEELARIEPLLLRGLAEEAKGLGLPVVTPMGDVEDMNLLSWDLAASGDSTLRQWSQSRYGTDLVWALALQWTTADATGGSSKSGRTLQARLLGGGLARANATPPAPLQAEVVHTAAAERCVEQGTHHTCPYNLLARTLLQQMADQWIQAHTRNPNQHLVALLRVNHGPKLAQMAQFVGKLKATPGVANLKFVEERALESSMQMDFNGQEDQLRAMLSQLGAQVEGRASAAPPATANPDPANPDAANPPGSSPPPPPAPVELLLRLP